MRVRETNEKQSKKTWKRRMSQAALSGILVFCYTTTNKKQTHVRHCYCLKNFKKHRNRVKTSKYTIILISFQFNCLFLGIRPQISRDFIGCTGIRSWDLWNWSQMLCQLSYHELDEKYCQTAVYIMYAQLVGLPSNY